MCDVHRRQDEHTCTNFLFFSVPLWIQLHLVAFGWRLPTVAVKIECAVVVVVVVAVVVVVLAVVAVLAVVVAVVAAIVAVVAVVVGSEPASFGFFSYCVIF